MKHLTFISVEDSEIKYKRLFDFKDRTIYVLSSGDEFTFHGRRSHKRYIIKSVDDLKIQDFMFSDKKSNLYIVGKKIHEKEGIYLADLSGVSEEKFNLIMREIPDYVYDFEYINPEDKWSVLIPTEHEDCIFRDDKVSTPICNHKDNIFKKCEKRICPIKTK